MVKVGVLSVSLPVLMYDFRRILLISFGLLFRFIYNKVYQIAVLKGLYFLYDILGKPDDNTQ